MQLIHGISFCASLGVGISVDYQSDLPNTITLWYGYRLIQALPAMFQATHTLPENTMDPLEALHASYLITTINSKRRTALRENKPFDTQCTIRHKPCTKNFPACGLSGVGNLADIHTTRNRLIRILRHFILDHLHPRDGV